MAVAYLTSSNILSARGGMTANYSAAFDSGATGTGRILIVGLVYENGEDPNVTAITYNGSSLTQQLVINSNPTDDFSPTVEIWTLLNPATGSNTLQFTNDDSTGTSADNMIVAAVYTGVNQSSPFDSTYTDDRLTTDDATFSMNKVADGAVVWLIGKDRGDETAWSAETDNTIRQAEITTSSAGTGESYALGDRLTGSGTVACGATQIGTGGNTETQDIAIAALSLNVESAGVTYSVTSSQSASSTVSGSVAAKRAASGGVSASCSVSAKANVKAAVTSDVTASGVTTGDCTVVSPPDEILFVDSVKADDYQNAAPSITVPAAAQEGDFAYCVITIDGPATGTLAVPSGFTELFNGDVPYDVYGACRIAIGYRILGGSEPASYTFTAPADEQITMSLSLWRFVDQVTPIDAAFSYTSTGDSVALPACPSVTTTSSNSVIITTVSLARGPLAEVIDLNNNYTPPATTTEVVDANLYAGSGYTGHAVGWEKQATPGASPSLQWSHAGDNTWGGFASTLAIRFSLGSNVYELTTTIGSVATATASLFTKVKLASTVSASASVSGDSVRKAHMQGSVTALASTTGMGVKKAHMQGSVTSAASATGASVRKAHMQGSVTAAASATGANVRKAHMQGSVAAISSAETTLNTVISLSGTAQASASSSLNSIGKVPFTASSSATANANSDLHVVISFSGAAQATASSGLSSTSKVPFTASVSASASAQSSVSRKVNAAGTSAASASTQVRLIRKTSFTGGVAASANTTIKIGTYLAASAPAEAVVSGRYALKRALNATAYPSADVVAFLSIRPPPSVFVVGSSNTYVTNSSSISLPKPANVQEGDFLLAVFSVDNDDGISLPNGFTQLAYIPIESQFISSIDHEGLVGYRIATNSETSLYTFYLDSSEEGLASIIAFRGVDLDAPISGVSQIEYGYNLNPTSTSVTTDTDGSLIISLFVGEGGDMEVTSGPQDMEVEVALTTESYGGANTGSGASIGIAWGIQNFAGPTGSKTYTLLDDDAWGALTVALRVVQYEEYFPFTTFNGIGSASSGINLRLRPTLPALAVAYAQSAMAVTFAPQLTGIATAEAGCATAIKFQNSAALEASASASATMFIKKAASSSVASEAQTAAINTYKKASTSSVVASANCAGSFTATFAPSLAVNARASTTIQPSAVLELTGSANAACSANANIVRTSPLVGAYELSRAEISVDSTVTYYPKLNALGVATVYGDMINKNVKSTVLGEAIASSKLGGTFVAVGTAEATAETSNAANFKKQFTGSLSASSTASVSATRVVSVTASVTARATVSSDATRLVIGAGKLNGSAVAQVDATALREMKADAQSTASAQLEAKRKKGVSASVSATALVGNTNIIRSYVSSDLQATATVSIATEVATKYFPRSKVKGVSLIRGRLSKIATVEMHMEGEASIKCILRGGLGVKAQTQHTIFVAPSSRRLIV